MSGRLQDRLAIVTGGAGAIGSVIVGHFCREGAKVVVADLDSSQNEDVVERMDSEYPGQVTFIKLDARDDAAVRAMASTVREKLGRIDILIPTVGGSNDALIHKMTDEQWDQVMELNLRTTFLACRAVTPFLMEQNYGKVVLISSRSHEGNVGQLNYSTAKAGIIGFTNALAKEMARYHVNVNCVVPGFVDNPRLSAMPEKRRKRRIGLNPFQIVATPDDVADAILFLASDEASHITGQAVRVAAW